MRRSAALPAVSGITVNTVHGNERSIAAVVQRFKPQVESMEGAAFMYACLIHERPFAQVRAVSNVVERRNRDAWKMAEAIGSLGATALRILERRMKLSLGFSPCPNDCFMFDAIVNRRIDLEGLEFSMRMADVEALNKAAFAGEADVTKLSYHAYAHCAGDYVLLDAGSALGRNCGPLLISKRTDLDGRSRGGRTAGSPFPGKYTTANFLLGLAFPGAREQDRAGVLGDRVARC